VINGIQYWTVPTTGTYRVEAWGARGGQQPEYNYGGPGARVRGDFILSQGQILKILVGQMGANAQNDCGAGGGGGGGYTGGASGNNNDNGEQDSGQGGSSYNAGAHQSNTSGAHVGHGQVTITRI
jgi:hypothetical protein